MQTHSIRTRLKENDSSFKKESRFKVTLIEEGLGNLQTRYFYTKESLQSSAHLFEGAKCYIDHPTLSEETDRPERSTRDILGYFENVKYEESSEKQGKLTGDLVTLKGPHFEWANHLIESALQYSQKFNHSDFVGLSINASGEAENETHLETFFKEQTLSPSVQEKLIEALAEGVESIRIVKNLSDVISCDLVTEAGAGGRILSMMESNKEKKMKKKLIKESKEMEKKEADIDHQDEDQDKELFAKMVAEYLGEESKNYQEALQSAMEAYEAYKEEFDSEEAFEKAGKHIQMQMKMNQKKKETEKEEDTKESDDEAQDENVDSEESDSEEDLEKKEEKKESSHGKLLRANAEIARLKEALKKYELSQYLEKKLSESKKPVSVTKKFRESLGSIKSKDQIDQSYQIFMSAYDLGSVGAEDSVGFMFAEKQSFSESDKTSVGSFSDCLE